GVAWSAVTMTGQAGVNDLCFVPGTVNTWVSSGIANGSGYRTGIYFSFDGGHSWAPFEGNENDQFLAVDFLNAHQGWAGGFNATSTEGGIFRFAGTMPSGTVFSPVSGLLATVIGKTVNLVWNAPATGEISGYHIYRNDTLITQLPILVPAYSDSPVANGVNRYCVKVIYSTGESIAVCTEARITFGIPEKEAAIRIYPNPVSGMLNIEIPEDFRQVRILSLLGQEVYSYSAPGKKLSILTSGFKSGMYLLHISTVNCSITRRITIR
ncbi:MAG: T9SS type A sorting domain-containing protein, partial [Bacteroidota bacterium]